MLTNLDLCQGYRASCYLPPFHLNPITNLPFYFYSPTNGMAPDKQDPPSSAAGSKPSAGKPKIFGGGTRQSARIQKRSANGNEDTKKPIQENAQGRTEAGEAQNAQPQRARPGLELAETRPSRRLSGSGLPSDRCLRRPSAARNATTRATDRVDDVQNESGEAVTRRTNGQMGYHTIAEGGPKLKNIAELIMEADTYENFRIPADKIIANEDVDTMVYQQMRRLSKDGDLTSNRVRARLIDSVKEFEDCWRIRNRSPTIQHSRFWKRACTCTSGTSGTWMNQLDGADCRQFFLWLLVYFRHGSGREGTNDLIRAFERLDELFKEEEKEKDSELDDLVGVQSRLRAPANRNPGRSRDRATVSRSAASKKKSSKKTSKSMPEDGNIFRWSADTNMSDYELSGIDVEGLTPVVDVGDRRRKDEDHKRVFDVYTKRVHDEEDAKDEQKAARTPKPQPMAQGIRRGFRKRATRFAVDDLTPEMGLEEPAKSGRPFSEFVEDGGDDDGEEERMLRAAFAKRQKLPRKMYAARGGPSHD